MSSNLLVQQIWEIFGIIFTYDWSSEIWEAALKGVPQDENHLSIMRRWIKQGSTENCVYFPHNPAEIKHQ